MALSNTAIPKYYGAFRDAVVRGDIVVNKEVSMQPIITTIGDDIITETLIDFDNKKTAKYIFDIGRSGNFLNRIFERLRILIIAKHYCIQVKEFLKLPLSLIFRPLHISLNCSKKSQVSHQKNTVNKSGILNVLKIQFFKQIE